MKKIFLLFCVLFISMNMYSQTYYHMYRSNQGEAGKPEYICNSSMALGGATGILFTTANATRAAVTASGRFYVVNPDVDYSNAFVQKMNSRVNGISNLAIATNGLIAGNGFELRKIGDNVELFASLKHGRNGDPTLISTADSWLRISGRNGVAIWGDNTSETNDSPTVRVEGSKVGIGFPMATSFIDELSVAGSFTSKNRGVETSLSTGDNYTSAWFGTRSNHGLYFGTNGGATIYIDPSNNFYIGLSKEERSKIRPELVSKYDLFVANGVLSEDFAIAPVSTWADFVFAKDYKLMKLNKLEKFIKENKHLPNVPSAKEVAKNGYSQHEVNKALLEKIEELTLYLIEQEKKIELLESKLGN